MNTWKEPTCVVVPPIKRPNLPYIYLTPSNAFKGTRFE
jgi:hypothetical protein